MKSVCVFGFAFLVWFSGGKVAVLLYIFLCSEKPETQVVYYVFVSGGRMVVEIDAKLWLVK